MDFKTRIGKLNNGIQYILSNNSNTQSVALLILIRYGAGFDSIRKSGSAHLLEHLIFKGTVKRPHTKDIMMELDSIGSEYNAYTSKTFTGYHSKSPHMYLESSIEILTDMLKNPKFLTMPKKDFLNEFNQEKKIVLQELYSIRDQYSKYIHQILEHNLFLEPFNRNCEDDIRDIESISLDDVIETYTKYYNSNNIIVSIHGNLNNVDKTEQLIINYFNDFKINIKNEVLFNKSKSINEIQHYDVFNKPNISKCHVLISYSDRGLEDRCKYYMTELFRLVFANLTSGRLFQNIREKDGLVYNIKSIHYCYDHRGYFSIQTNTDKENLENVLEKIAYEINNVKTNGLTKKEFELSIKNYKAKLLLDSEDSMNIAHHNAYELFYTTLLKKKNNKFTSYFDVIEIINSFTLDSMNLFIKELLQDKAIITLIKS